MGRTGSGAKLGASLGNWIFKQLLMGVDLLPDFIRSHYEVHEYQHACAILRQDFPAEWRDLCDWLQQSHRGRDWMEQ